MITLVQHNASLCINEHQCTVLHCAKQHCSAPLEITHVEICDWLGILSIQYLCTLDHSSHSS